MILIANLSFQPQSLISVTLLVLAPGSRASKCGWVKGVKHRCLRILFCPFELTTPLISKTRLSNHKAKLTLLKTQDRTPRWLDVLRPGYYTICGHRCEMKMEGSRGTMRQHWAVSSSTSVTAGPPHTPGKSVPLCCKVKGSSICCRSLCHVPYYSPSSSLAAQIFTCIDWLSIQRPFTWPLFVWLHIFMTQNGQHGAALLLSINHSCFANHHWLHLSLSYLLLSSEKRCEVSLACSALHDMICVSAYKSFSNEPCVLSFPPTQTLPPQKKEEKGHTSVKWQHLWKMRVGPTWLSSDTSSSALLRTLLISSTSGWS